MRGWAPACLTGDRERTARTIFINIESLAPPSVTVSRRHRGRSALLGRLQLGAGDLLDPGSILKGRRASDRVVLGIPPGELLERLLVLPLAAERDLAQVMRYEMDRFTPFRADELYWTVAVKQRDRAGGKLQILLSLVPKARLAVLLSRLAALGVVPT